MYFFHFIWWHSAILSFWRDLSGRRSLVLAGNFLLHCFCRNCFESALKFFLSFNCNCYVFSVSCRLIDLNFWEFQIVILFYVKKRRFLVSFVAIRFKKSAAYLSSVANWKIYAYFCFVIVDKWKNFFLKCLIWVIFLNWDLMNFDYFSVLQAKNCCLKWSLFCEG